MTNLKVFQFSGCQELQVLPHNITSQASLRKLDFSYTSSLRELPASIDQLSELEELLFEGLPLLTRLPYSLGNMSNLITLRLGRCQELYDMPSLAGLVSLNNLHVEDCPKLYDISSFAGLASLNNLCIKACPNLYDMPNLGGLVSLNNLCVQGCSRIMKIEGLEHSRSLENLNVQTDWMVPGILSLRCAERLPLRTLTLQAADISAFGACIESMDQMEKWPCEMTLCGNFFARARSILDNFIFPGLVVVNKMVYYEDDCYTVSPFQSMTYAKTTLPWEHTNPSDAAIACFHVKNYKYSSDSIRIQGIESSKLRMSPGEWIVMTVLREVPFFLLTDKCLRLRIGYITDDASSGSIIVGERRRCCRF